ncbi:hypothetical protein DWUX_2614 [Desulfovibrio diazotrophicus]|nr:hypothetical protein DWUX_2614 [Desulfovibrio diazotrophicus]
MVIHHKPFFVGTYKRTYKIFFRDVDMKIKTNHSSMLLFY